MARTVKKILQEGEYSVRIILCFKVAEAYQLSSPVCLERVSLKKIKILLIRFLCIVTNDRN